MKADPKQAILEAIESDWTKQASHAPVWIFEVKPFLSGIATAIEAKKAEDYVAILAAWHELHRTGVIGYGYWLPYDKEKDRSGSNDGQNGYNPNWAHVTKRGRAVLENVRRDPSNPTAYLAYVENAVPKGTIPRSYLDEALETYGSGCDKATVVLLGGASEALILELRDAIGAKYDAASKTRPKGTKTTDWGIKGVIDGVKDVLDAQKKAMPNDLWERYQYRFTVAPDIIRRARNDVGHPNDLTPVTRDDVHALLLLFPEAAKLARELIDWVTAHFAP